MNEKAKTRRPRENESQTDTDARSKELTFEEALSALERTVEDLEKDNLTLDQALRFFEQGIRLMRQCDSHLKDAQGKIKELLKGENGAFVEKVLGITLESFLSREETDE